jgi:hypothetical protein
MTHPGACCGAGPPEDHPHQPEVLPSHESGAGPGAYCKEVVRGSGR